MAASMFTLALSVLVGLLWQPVTAQQDQSASLPSSVRLLNHLRALSQQYGVEAVPIHDYHRESIAVEFGLRLIGFDVNEQMNVLTTSAWVRQKWNNLFLRWNASDFGDISRITIPVDWVWTPDISLVNTADADFKERVGEIRLGDNGDCFWLKHSVFKSACLIDVTNYPYDEQECDLWFQSLSNPSFTLDLHPYAHNRSGSTSLDQDTYLSDFKNSDEWAIMRNDSVRLQSPRDAGELLMFSRRVTLRFTLALRRRVGFSAYLLTIPCIVLGAMSAIIFVLPPERPDRHGIATSLMASFVMLLFILINTAPPSAASIPTLGLFYASNIGIIVFSLALSSIVVSVLKRADKGYPFPNCLEPYLDKCAHFCCVIPPSRVNAVKKPGKNDAENVHLNGRHRSPEPEASPDAVILFAPPTSEAEPLIKHLFSVEKRMVKIESALCRINRTLQEQRKPPPGGHGNCHKWKILALLLDKIFLILIMVAVVINIALLLPRPHY